MKSFIKRILPAAAAAGLLALSLPSFGHQQWLSPNFVNQSSESAWLSFDHTFGDQRFLPSSGPGSYYSWWIVGVDGFKRNIPHLFLGKTRTVGEIELTESGTYRIEAVEDLMPFTLIKVDDEDTWQPGTRADFAGFEVVRSRTYFNKAVTYVTLEAPSDLSVASTGDPLEIVFIDHPTGLEAGKGFGVRVLASGRALIAQEVQVFSEDSHGHDATEKCATDKNGLCMLTLAAAGRYLLTTSTQGDHSDGSSTDGYSYGYSVLVELK